MANLEDRIVNIQRNIVVKERTPIRKKINGTCVKMTRIIAQKGSCTMLKKYQQQLEDLWEECEPLGEQLLDIYTKLEDEEAWDQEMDSQTEYSERVSMTLNRTEEYLKGRLGEPPSVCASKAGSIIQDRQGRLAEFQSIRVDQAIEIMKNALERHTIHPTVQATTKNPPRTNQTEDDWIEKPRDDPGSNSPISGRSQQASHFPTLKLEPFDGDSTKWTEFASAFKMLVHDVVPTEYQRMEHLRMYLTPKVKSSISTLLTDSKLYRTALQSLKQNYGHPLLITRANLAAIGNLPYVRVGDIQSLERFAGCLSDVVSSLTRAALDKEFSSLIKIESVLKKLPCRLINEWREQITRNSEDFNLLNLSNWLQNEVLSRKNSHPLFIRPPSSSNIRQQNSTSRFPRRVNQTTARTGNSDKLECLETEI